MENDKYKLGEEAMKKVKYPQDKIFDPDDPNKIAFNDGWNALHHQLMMIRKKHNSQSLVRGKR